MLCSILITTRKRVPRLLATLRSIRDTVSTQDNIEVWLRFDDDDQETLAAIPECRSIINRVHYQTGSRMAGWGSVYYFWDEIYKKCSGTWAWMISDDMVIVGNGWDLLLQKVPTEGFIVHPEIHQLGPSIYPEDRGGPTPIIPRGSLEQHGFDGVPDPPDVGINESFRLKSGWGIRFLPGIGIWHQRSDDATLVAERSN